MQIPGPESMKRGQGYVYMPTNKDKTEYIVLLSNQVDSNKINIKTISQELGCEHDVCIVAPLGSMYTVNTFRKTKP